MAIPIVTVFSGHDPTAGAGIHADIETLFSLACYANSILTCLTIQNTKDIQAVQLIQPECLYQQAQILFQDMLPKVIKIGLIPDVATAKVIKKLLQQYPQIPVVFDPILRSGGGQWSAQSSMLDALVNIMPYIAIITPNSQEARQLTQQQTLTGSAKRLLANGCDYVLITGTHETDDDDKVKHLLYAKQGWQHSITQARLKGDYHGSGCTLAAAIAGFMAKGFAMTQAVELACQFAWSSLESAHNLGQGQALPNRSFWSKLK